MRGWRAIHLELSLATDLIDWSFVSELSNELVGLNVNVLLTWGSLWRLDIPGEELLGSLGSLLFEALRIILSLVCLEELIRVGSRGDDHGSIGASTEDTLVESNVLRIVLLGMRTTVGILVLLLLGDDPGMCSEPLSASSATRLLQHF